MIHLRTLLTLTAALGLSAHAVTAERLIVSDARTNELSVIDAASGQRTARFSTPGPLSGLYTGPSGTLGYAIHRDSDRVTVLDGGLSGTPTTAITVIWWSKRPISWPP
ncbi:YncE family protein [Deinococcus arenicola]|uniref:Uncharacterized protein n=1 Tax=Deinococcus arenicola TaxID=2994950 RepID=A0ABU4DUD1_9DEIO|nr:hypothetical protein [Deinococcus sp. ZS9-10]MDV6376041.1 hypothetical protein [Deinococcus sp. ZS9-10]